MSILVSDLNQYLPSVGMAQARRHSRKESPSIAQGYWSEERVIMVRLSLSLAVLGTLPAEHESRGEMAGHIVGNNAVEHIALEKAVRV